MSRERKYKPKAFDAAVEKYFASITRVIQVTEAQETGEKDEKGHTIFRNVPVLNSLGEPVTDVQWLLPPSVEDLCEYLGISRSTWNNLAQTEGYVDTISRARGRMRAWNVRQLLTRQGKDVKGIIFNLQNNYGYSEKREIEMGQRAGQAFAAAAAPMPMAQRLELLQDIARQFGDSGISRETERDEA